MELMARIAFIHIRNRLRQTVVSILGVVLGVSFSIAMAALMQGSQDDFVQSLIDAIPHIEITAEERHPRPQPAARIYDAVVIQGLRPREAEDGIRNALGIIASLRSWVPGSVAPTLTGQAVVRYGGRDLSISLQGIEIQSFQTVSKIEEDMKDGRLAALETTANGIVVGDQVLTKLGADLGTLITLTTSAGVTRKFKIVGTFHTGVASSDAGLAYTLLKTAQVVQDKANKINQIRIRLDDVTIAEPLAQRLESQFGYKAESWEAANEGLLEAFAIRNIIMFTVVAAILLVAGFGIYNIISQITHEKARDIAIMKSLGFQDRDVIGIFVIEGSIIGFAGAVVGCLVGYGLSVFLGGITFDMSATGRDVTNLPIAYNPLHYVIASAFALFSAAIAGYLPARSAAAVNPVDIIRGAS